MLVKLQEQLKDAMLARDEIRVATLRLLISEIRNTQIAKGHDLSDEEILEVASKEAKKRRESVISFRAANREDLASQEAAELKILEEYLPVQMSDEELTNLVKRAITEMGATTVSDLGKIIGSVMGKVKGQASGDRVAAIAKTWLTL